MKDNKLPQKPIFSIRKDGTCATIIETPVEICTIDFENDKIKFHKDYWLSIDSVTSTMAQYDKLKQAYIKTKEKKNGKKKTNNDGNDESSK